PLLEQDAEGIEFALPHGELRNRSSTTGGGRAQSKSAKRTVRIAYLDAFSGISGDMTVGALLHAGLPLSVLRDAIAALGLRDVELDAEPVTRSGIRATKFHVRVRGEHADHAHGHGHRAWTDIRELLQQSALPDAARASALAIFARLAEAEGRVHGVPT